ncbi:hypothetical protein [Bacillus sp. JCM 19034]|uniref:hypothetical protein n=1 Tax=Bacillus sp. JCM 19034 TaxID=1481928 RepID=UPI00078185A0|nr:hypothetical protein [Bacillus sp. JCM 19034]
MTNLGKYKQMPPTLEKLIKLERELEKEGYSLDRDLCFILQTEYFAYDVTPYDVITFASIGSDGIHFGLLTDFGKVTHLENAFVVCISPMDFGSHINIVARNIKEFFSLVCTMKSPVAISNFGFINSEEQYTTLINEIKEEEKEHPEYTEKADYIIDRLQTVLECDVIENVYDYVEKKVISDRKEQTILSTLDGLGIVPVNESNVHHSIYRLEADSKINMDDIQSFFNNATIESKLSFIRDAQFTYLISNETDLKKFVIKEMLELGLYDEVARLKRIDT